MIKFPYKRIIGLLGVPRSGKNTVAKYLQESRNFATMAFADKIKEEYGITKEDFEAAKITGDIEKLRQDLWDFSASKKKKEPLYFIDKVIKDALNLTQSVIITDIRTINELDCFLAIPVNKRIYWIIRGMLKNQFNESNILKGSKLKEIDIFKGTRKPFIYMLKNNFNGSYKLIKYLEQFFFKEDIIDLVGSSGDSSEYDKHIKNKKWMTIASDYISQFSIGERI